MGTDPCWTVELPGRPWFSVWAQIGDRPWTLEQTPVSSDQTIKYRSNRAYTCKNHTVPYGTDLLGWRSPRHFVPGYDRIVPPGHFKLSNFQTSFLGGRPLWLRIWRPSPPDTTIGDTTIGDRPPVGESPNGDRTLLDSRVVLGVLGPRLGEPKSVAKCPGGTVRS
jgi:hypothetical protein